MQQLQLITYIFKLGMSHPTVQGKRVTSQTFNESFVQKSIISDQQQPRFNQKINYLNAEVDQLREQLNYYKKQVDKSKSNSFYSKTGMRENSQNLAGSDMAKIMDLTNEVESIRQENQDLKKVIKNISEELRVKKKQSQFDDRNISAEYDRLKIHNQRLKEQNKRRQKQIQQLQQKISQLKRVNNKNAEVIQSQRRQLDYDRNELNQDLHIKNMNQQLKISELTENISEYLHEIESLNMEVQKLRKENVIDRKNYRSTDNFRGHQKSPTRYSVMQNSRMSELDQIDAERFNIKLSEKNKQYDQLYLKYQSLENQYNTMEELNNDLERQRKFLADRLSDIQIHTEGDEIAGELENKLVLMSTELMRLGNLSRTKTQQCKDLNTRLKQIILKRENLERDIIERDKLILNYKEEIRILEMRSNEKIHSQLKISRVDNEAKQRNAKLMKEIERITSQYKQKSELLKNSEIKNAILDEKYQRLSKQNEQLERQVKELSTNKDRFKNNNTQIMNLQAEITFYKQSNSNLKDEMRRIENKFHENRSDSDRINREREEARYLSMQLQDKITSLQEDLRRTNLRLDDKQMQLRQINHKSEQKSIINSNELKIMEQKIVHLENQIQRNSRNKSELIKYEELIRQIQRLEGVQLSLKLQISSYQEKLVMLAQENQRLNFVVQGLNNDGITLQKVRLDREQKEKQIRTLQNDVQSLKNRQRRYKQEAETLRQKLRGTVIQQRQYETWEFKNRQLRDEIDVLKTQLSVKDTENCHLNQRYQKQTAEKYALILRNEELNSRVQNNYKSDSSDNSFNRKYFQSEIKRLMDKHKEDEQKIKQLQREYQQSSSVYTTFSQQIERLNIVLGQRANEIINFKKEIDFLQHKVRTCEESLSQRNTVNINSERSIAEAESKSKIDICQGKIRNYEGQLDLLKQRCQGLKDTNSSLQSKISQLTSDKIYLQQKLNDLQYQHSQKLQNFRSVEDSFKLTILQIKRSNQRLEQSVKQIQNHYISRLQSKQNQCDRLRKDKHENENHIYELQKRLSNMEIEHGSQIKQKMTFINHLSSNHNQTKEQIETIKRYKSEFEIKVTLLSQQIERLSHLNSTQNVELEKMREQLRHNDDKYTSSMRQSSANHQTIDTLSTEIQRLNTVLLENVEKLRVYQAKLSKSQAYNQQIKRGMDQYRNKIEEYEQKYRHERENITEKSEKLEQANKHLSFQIQEKSKDCERLAERIRSFELRDKGEAKELMKSVEETKSLKQGNQQLQNKLGLITREYEQLITQLQYYKKPKINDGDEKMRIIGNYEATIKYMKEENMMLTNQKNKALFENERLNKMSGQMQERGRISEEKARVFQQKCKRFEERCRIVEERLRGNEDLMKGLSIEKAQIQHKMISAMQQVGRLQLIIKTKQTQIEKMEIMFTAQKTTHMRSEYYSNDNIRDKKGIFIIKEANEVDERSRSASGNNVNPALRHPSNVNLTDLQHRYDLMESLNKKLSSEGQCLRKKNVQYQFKMNKLKQQFDLINRLIHEYRQENEKLKENNKLLSMQMQQRNNHHINNSGYSSPQHSSIKNNSFLDAHRSSFSPTYINGQTQRSAHDIPRNDKQDISVIKSKLLQQIDRLNRVNNSLQNEVHDLRLNSSDSVSLRKRMEQNLALVVILFAEIQSLRIRVSQSERQQSLSPVNLKN